MDSGHEPRVSPEAFYQPGSEADFGRLYRDSYQRLYRTVYAIAGGPAAAEDIVQEAFVKAYQAWSRWSPEAPAEAWLHRIALNVAVSHRRRERLRDVGELVRRLGRPAISDDPAQAAERADLVGALTRLKPELAAAIVLRHYHGYTNREISIALGVSERTVGLRLAEAKRRLATMLGPAWGGLPTSEAASVEMTVVVDA